MRPHQYRFRFDSYHARTAKPAYSEIVLHMTITSRIQIDFSYSRISALVIMDFLMNNKGQMQTAFFLHIGLESISLMNSWFDFEK